MMVVYAGKLVTLVDKGEVYPLGHSLLSYFQKVGNEVA